MILPFGERTAQIDPTAVVFESAWVIGSVRLGPRSSVWFGSVVRADVDDVEMGDAGETPPSNGDDGKTGPAMAAPANLDTVSTASRSSDDESCL